jgi:alpha-L-fucosidase
MKTTSIIGLTVSWMFGAQLLLPAASPYQPTWESLRQHPDPSWYADAKFGIYFHWSAYSVPAFGSEWYSRNLYQTNNPAYRHHVATYGPVDRFGYKDFIPLFKAEKLQADEWATLFQKAGARFAGPVAEHADGFSLWNSRVNPWNAARMGPHRDLVGELAQAIRRHHLKFITTFHHQWLWGWYANPDTHSDVYQSANAGFYGPPLPTSAFDYVHPVPPPNREFLETWKAKLLEVVQQYQPDLVYFDSRLSIIPEDYRKGFLAEYYNQARRWGREVAVTYKGQDLAPGTAIEDLEQGRMTNITARLWQNDDTIDWNSWAYLERPNYKPVSRLIHELADIVSKNGVLLLDIGPKPDGTIPAPIQERLLAIGAWLKINGEAIYGTRPFQVFGEGPTEVKGGHFGEAKIKEFTAQDIRYTTRGGALYAIVLGWPTQPLTLRSLARNAPGIQGQVRRIQMLGAPGNLSWTQNDQGLTIRLPASPPCPYAVVCKITGLKWNNRSK